MWTIYAVVSIAICCLSTASSSMYPQCDPNIIDHIENVFHKRYGSPKAYIDAEGSNYYTAVAFRSNSIPEDTWCEYHNIDCEGNLVITYDSSCCTSTVSSYPVTVSDCGVIAETSGEFEWHIISAKDGVACGYTCSPCGDPCAPEGGVTVESGSCFNASLVHQCLRDLQEIGVYVNNGFPSACKSCCCS